MRSLSERLFNACAQRSPPAPDAREGTRDDGPPTIGTERHMATTVVLPLLVLVVEPLETGGVVGHALVAAPCAPDERLAFEELVAISNAPGA